MATMMIGIPLLGGCGSEPEPEFGATDILTVTAYGKNAQGLPEIDGIVCSDRPGVCRAIAKAAVPREEFSCAQMYGGPQRLVVRGQIRGQMIALNAGRSDSCEIALYDQLAEITRLGAVS